MSAARPVIEVADLTVRYDDFTLGPVALRIDAGERVALVGGNGAGKSTTLRAMVGLVPEHEGHVRMDGIDVKALGASVRTRIGMLPERLLGFGWSSVADHLRFLASFYPTWDAGYADALRRRLEVPEATKLANLSKGMQVKLSLVVAEAFRPSVLLLDEPTSGIDPVMRGEVLRLVGECIPPGGDRTVLFSTHILEDVEDVADRVVLLRRGRVLHDARCEILRSEDDRGSLSRAIYRRLADA